MVWSIADICELLNRNKSRAVEDMFDYLKKDYTESNRLNNKNLSAPRLPKIDWETYTKDATKIEQVFLEIIQKCKIPCISWESNNKTHHNYVRFIVIDNTSRDTIDPVIFDSKSDTKNNPTVFTQLLKSKGYKCSPYIKKERNKKTKRRNKKTKRKKNKKTKRQN